MSEANFDRATCRNCGNNWDLPRVYGQAELVENFNEGDRLSVCPSCGSDQVSFFPVDADAAPPVPTLVEEGKPMVKTTVVRAEKPEDLEATDILDPFREDEDHEQPEA